jgi:hypothetical protein
MPKMNAANSRSGQSLSALALPLLLASSAHAQYDRNWLFHVRVGGLLTRAALSTRGAQYHIPISNI